MSLTQDLGVISAERAGYSAIPGHDLVVFELKDGYRNMTVVEAGQQFTPRRALPFVKVDYVSYAVNRNPAMQHKFTRRLEHMTASHSFDLTFTVTFRVSGPEKLVDRRVDDPIRRLSDEVARTLGSILCAEPWTDIVAGKRRDNLNAMWQRLWQRSAQGLKDFATLYGLELAGVDGALGLNEADEEPSRKAEDLARKKEVSMTQEQLDRIERERRTKNEIEDIRVRADVDKAQHQLKRQQETHKIEIATLEVKTDLVKGTGATILGGMKAAASHIDTFEALERGVRVGARIVQPLLGGNMAGAAYPGGGGETLGMLAGPDSPELVKLVSEILNQYGELAEQRGRPREFIAAALHWVAELSLGSAANATRLREYSVKLRDPPEDLSGAQLAFLQKLLDEEQIKAILS